VGARVELDPDELVDLYGERGFDVLCITDHVVRADDSTSHELAVAPGGVRVQLAQERRRRGRRVSLACSKRAGPGARRGDGAENSW
jgi:hypothetical protein